MCTLLPGFGLSGLEEKQTESKGAHETLGYQNVSPLRNPVATDCGILRRNPKQNRQRRVKPQSLLRDCHGHRTS